MKKFTRVAELGFELRCHFLSHNVAALANAWSDGSTKVTGIATEMAAHLADPFFDNARCGSSPTSVKGADDSTLRIDYEHGRAVCDLDGKQQAGRAGDQPITGRYGIRDSVDPMHQP